MSTSDLTRYLEELAGQHVGLSPDASYQLGQKHLAQTVLGMLKDQENPLTGTLPKPDWTMTGVPVPGGVRVYASRDLPAASFGMEERDQASYWRLRALMQNLVIEQGAAYPEALAKVQDAWQRQDAAAT